VSHNTLRPPGLAAVAAAIALALTACGAGSLGSSEEDEGGEGGGVTLSWLMDSAETTTTRAEGVVAAFEEANPDISVEIETRPGGSEGDNIVKTRLSTGDMTDIFQYNTGSLFQALNPGENLVPVTDEEWVAGVDETFTTTVSADNEVYGAPFGEAMGGGILYNKRVYEELGLEVPKTWADFMANNDEIKAAGITPIIQTYGDTWTSQLFVLGDFHNVATADPSWAEKYTANEVKYVEEPAIKGFQHQQEAFEADAFNEDFGAAKFPDGLEKLANGEGVHYPILTFVLAEIAANFPDQIQDIGFFGIPGDDAATHGATVWTAGGVYIPTTTEGDKLEAAKTFLAFLASPEGCDAQAEASPPMGPYQVTECELPSDVPPAVTDLQAYFDQEGATTPALEFLSPVKGPALEQITVEVGSGIRSAEEGAALYDEDVKKQAQQLGLPGWE
jgi:raffinose/stachyose/melibiose transport system substrate-binding protein